MRMIRLAREANKVVGQHADRPWWILGVLGAGLGLAAWALNSSTAAASTGSSSGSGGSSGGVATATTKTLLVGQTSDLSALATGTWSNWKSSNPTIVSVDSSGSATAVGIGQADVTATDSGGDQLTVTVAVFASTITLPTGGVTTVTPTDPAAPVTDATWTSLALSALNGLIAVGIVKNVLMYAAGTPLNDPAVVSAIKAYQALMPVLPQTGVLDYQTAAAIFATDTAYVASQPPNTTPPIAGLVSDPRMVALAQTALNKLITAGKTGLLTVPVTVNGNTSDPQFIIALSIIQTSINSTTHTAFLVPLGQLDYATWAFIVAYAYAF